MTPEKKTGSPLLRNPLIYFAYRNTRALFSFRFTLRLLTSSERIDTMDARRLFLMQTWNPDRMERVHTYTQKHKI